MHETKKFAIWLAHSINKEFSFLKYFTALFCLTFGFSSPLSLFPLRDLDQTFLNLLNENQDRIACKQEFVIPLSAHLLDNCVTHWTDFGYCVYLSYTNQIQPIISFPIGWTLLATGHDDLLGFLFTFWQPLQNYEYQIKSHYFTLNFLQTCWT